MPVTSPPLKATVSSHSFSSTEAFQSNPSSTLNALALKDADAKLRRKIDLRLCTIAGILASLDLLDSGILSSASVTSLLSDLGLEGNRYSVSIFIFTVSSIAFQLPATLAVRFLGPRLFFALITFSFGLITLVCAYLALLQCWF